MICLRSKTWNCRMRLQTEAWVLTLYAAKHSLKPQSCHPVSGQSPDTSRANLSASIHLARAGHEVETEAHGARTLPVLAIEGFPGHPSAQQTPEASVDHARGSVHWGRAKISLLLPRGFGPSPCPDLGTCRFFLFQHSPGVENGKLVRDVFCTASSLSEA